MKESLWIYILMILGLFVIVVMMLIQDLTSTSEEDYYLAKEALEASMVDSLDLGLYIPFALSPVSFSDCFLAVS